MPKGKVALRKEVNKTGDDDINYDENLTVKVPEIKPNESMDLKHCFGILLRSNVEIDKNHKYCDVCLKSKIIKRYGLSTSNTNLWNHLRDKHQMKLEHKRTVQNQKKVTEMLLSVGKETSKLSDLNHDRRFLLARQLCLWFCRDLLSFNEVGKPGIHDFALWAGVIKKDEELPDRTTLSNAALNDVYTSLSDCVHKYVETKLPNTISISFDFWTDNIKRISYITYWVHWVDSEFNMQKICLGIVRFPHPHTGENVAEALKRLKQDYKLENKTLLGVTDNGENLKKACRILKMARDSCLAHNFHLLVADDLIKKHPDMKSIRDLISRMKTVNKALIYRYEDLKQINDDEYNKRLFHVVSTLKNISELLETADVTITDFDVELDDVDMLNRFCNEQVRNSTQFTTIKNSNTTRWNSVNRMFKSFKKNWDTINKCLETMKSYDLILSATELTLCEDFIKVLEIFEQATDLLQGDSYPSLNLALVCYVDIRKSLDTLLDDRTIERTSIIRTAATFLLGRLDHRFPITENMVVASFLDPSMKDLPIIASYCQKNESDMVSLMLKKWREYDVELPLKERSKKKSPSKDKPNITGATKLRLELIKKYAQSDREDVNQNDVEASIHKEYAQYIAISDLVEDPLLWWKSHQATFPYLSSLAKIMLSIPATSASTERHFSEAGVLVTKRKAQIDPLTVEKILFIHSNFKFISGVEDSLGKFADLLYC